MAEKLSSVFLDANRGSGDNSTYKKFSKPSLTEQQHKEAVDVNNIVRQYTMQGYRSEDFKNLADRVFADASRFVDNTDALDLVDASNLMKQAEYMFIQNVPAKIREQYGNDPMQFYKACVATNGDASKIRALFGDVKNYAVPNVEQLAQGNHIPSSTSSNNNDPQDE